MKIDLSGRHGYQVSEMLRDYVDEKMSKLDRFSLVLESAHVIFEAEKVNQTCEIIILGKDLRINAKETTKAMQASLDAAVSRLQSQLRKHHDRLKHHDRQSVRDVVESVPEDDDEKDL